MQIGNCGCSDCVKLNPSDSQINYDLERECVSTLFFTLNILSIANAITLNNKM